MVIYVNSILIAKQELFAILFLGSLCPGWIAKYIQKIGLISKGFRLSLCMLILSLEEFLNGEGDSFLNADLFL